jgi:hypothetical protein
LLSIFSIIQGWFWSHALSLLVLTAHMQEEKQEDALTSCRPAYALPHLFSFSLVPAEVASLQGILHSPLFFLT